MPSCHRVELSDDLATHFACDRDYFDFVIPGPVPPADGTAAFPSGEVPASGGERGNGSRVAPSVTRVEGSGRDVPPNLAQYGAGPAFDGLRETGRRIVTDSLLASHTCDQREQEELRQHVTGVTTSSYPGPALRVLPESEQAEGAGRAPTPARDSASDNAAAAIFASAIGLVLVAMQFYRKKQNAA